MGLNLGPCQTVGRSFGGRGGLPYGGGGGGGGARGIVADLLVSAAPSAVASHNLPGVRCYVELFYTVASLAHPPFVDAVVLPAGGAVHSHHNYAPLTEFTASNTKSTYLPLQFEPQVERMRVRA